MDDNGTSSPYDFEGIKISESTDKMMSMATEVSNKNNEFNESEGSHIENIVRGEVSNSRGVVIPLRETYKIEVKTYLPPITGLNGKIIRGASEIINIKVINVIKKNYDYYNKE